MITKRDLQIRVHDRKRELEAEITRLNEFRGNVTEFVGDIKTRSVIYNLVKNLPLWRRLEELISSDDSSKE